MRILLVAINAKYIHSCPAVYSLRGSCRHPEAVEIAEYTINDRYQDILGGILEREADLIGFSTYIWNTQSYTGYQAGETGKRHSVRRRSRGVLLAGEVSFEL